MGRRLFRKAATIEEQRLSPFLPHLFEGERILEWTTAKTLHGQEGTLAVSDTRLFWCDEPLDTGAVEVFDYRRIHEVGAKPSKHFLVVRAIREGLLETEVASGDSTTVTDGSYFQVSVPDSYSTSWLLV